MDVQNFMRERTGLWWPTQERAPSPEGTDQERGGLFAGAVMPSVRRDGDQLLVDWKQGDQILFRFEPLPLT
jgi:hypothetical protein